uniref:Cytochrome c oxidase subunit 2 n=1 Tax=Anisocentropus maculatus TaxID=2904904 RepID=A0A9E8LNN6_9NEOP|nr:cytochrome c oxidase subunit II [Anisocentropus maculatus]UZZ43755.1 cytochrome c oxidase subunit II [Anisocentropus maculatus]
MHWLTLNFQNSSSPLMEQLIFFHDHSLMILLIITIFEMYLIMNLFMNKFMNRFLLEKQFIELVWTIMPSIVLIFIALPSLKLLYLLDETNKPMITLKIIGHQWYWSYEYTDFTNINFDSYMTKWENLNNFRLLDVDNRIILPMKMHIRSLITSTDVIHAWTIPTLGLKMDAVPGRINQVNFYLNHTGLFFGQCSEICGMNHSFMPIMLESISMNYFINWIKNYH